MCVLLAFTSLLDAAPASFEAAKVLARQQVWHDRNQTGSFYCGCDWEWAGRSGGRVNLESCGYVIRAQVNRAVRIEWEHIVPASLFGQQRLCWQQGGRPNCKRVDPLFNLMEADLHNLAPAIGEANADRSNYRFAMLPDTPYNHGQCPIKISFIQRAVEPRDEIKGLIARVYFYMHDRYDLRLSRQQEQLLMAWNLRYPPDAWELERDRRITAIMGHGNAFVRGERAWLPGHRNTAEGVRRGSPAQVSNEAARRPVIGNSRSRVYHLPKGCPSYSSVSAGNRIAFNEEAQAIREGYRKAGNCR
nr:endonuclease [Halopseudomonas nanhaiensis]